MNSAIQGIPFSLNWNFWAAAVVSMWVWCLLTPRMSIGSCIQQQLQVLHLKEWVILLHSHQPVFSVSSCTFSTVSKSTLVSLSVFSSWVANSSFSFASSSCGGISCNSVACVRSFFFSFSAINTNTRLQTTIPAGIFSWIFHKIYPFRETIRKGQNVCTLNPLVSRRVHFPGLLQLQIILVLKQRVQAVQQHC